MNANNVKKSGIIATPSIIKGNKPIVMKKLSLLLICCAFVMASCTETPKEIQTIDQVHEQWPAKTIKAPKNADILQLVEAFQKAYPTYSVEQLLKEAPLPEEERQFLVETDMTGGYLSFAEGSDDKSSESMSAHVWQRNNGHQLLGIVFDQESSQVKTFVALYDYDPKSGKLKPEQPLEFTPSYPDAIMGIRLPQEGDELMFNEYYMNWWSSIRHHYAWDGMNFVDPWTEIEAVDEMQLQEDYDSYFTSSDPVAKYALVDIDEDGEPELLLSSEDEDYQEVYSIVQGQSYYLAGTDYRRSLCFYKGVVGDVGGCGTGCYYSYYTKLENSVPLFNMGWFQLYGFNTDTNEEQVEEEFYLNEEEISVEEGRSIHDSFGEPKEINPVWIQF